MSKLLDRAGIASLLCGYVSNQLIADELMAQYDARETELTSLRELEKAARAIVVAAEALAKYGPLSVPISYFGIRAALEKLERVRGGQ